MRSKAGLLKPRASWLFDSADEAEGVLFDGSWLWESYIWSLLQHPGSDLNFQHTDNRKKSGGWSVQGLGTSFYPDFFFVGPNQCEPRIVLDAKYTSALHSIDHLRQVFAYMFLLDAQRGGLIKPDDCATASDHQPAPIRITGPNETRGEWHDVIVRIPRDVRSAREFRIQMENNEGRFLKTVRNMKVRPTFETG
jgi:hypothetical protein